MFQRRQRPQAGGGDLGSGEGELLQFLECGHLPKGCVADACVVEVQLLQLLEAGEFLQVRVGKLGEYKVHTNDRLARLPLGPIKAAADFFDIGGGAILGFVGAGHGQGDE